MHPIGRDYNRQCLCNQLESRQSIEILPRGPHCNTTEVIRGITEIAHMGKMWPRVRENICIFINAFYANLHPLT
uniref:Uncharacterized protein n=1 Tax=Oncorhynchus kisutch TaxID=8019 RepID=A0A8C7DRG8_ONCKI